MELINFLAGNNICSDGTIPNGVFTLTSTIILIIQVVVPVLLIIWGMLDFAKAVIGGDENKIKEGQKVFIKRLIAAIVVFLIITVVKLLVNVIGNLGAESVDTSTVKTCITKFVGGPDASE